MSGEQKKCEDCQYWSLFWKHCNLIPQIHCIDKDHWEQRGLNENKKERCPFIDKCRTCYHQSFSKRWLECPVWIQTTITTLEKKNADLNAENLARIELWKQEVEQYNKQIAQLKAEVERLNTENGKACDSYQKWANEQGIYINQLLNDRDELSERLAKELHEHEVSMEEIERLTKLLSSIYKALVDYPIENGKAIVDVGNYNAVIEELKPFNKDGDG